ncbi:MAG: V-type ATP synthase subunit I [Thermoplasmata archaeon]|nr:MAG: V-type ATP synthase subunit I [Thermoplasmata archaeon]
MRHKPKVNLGGRNRLLYPEEMKEISIIVHDDYVDGLVRSLHESGLIETIDVGKSGKDFTELLAQSKAPKIAVKCADLEMQLNKIIEILDRAKDEGPKTLKEIINEFLSPSPPPKYKVKLKSAFEAQESASELIFKLEPKVIQIERKLEEVSEELASLAEHKKQISTLATLDLRLDYLGESEYLILKAGTTTDVDRLQDALKKVPDSMVFISQVEKKLYCVAVLAHIEDKEALESALKGVFSGYSLPDYKGKPKEAIEVIDNRTRELDEQKKSLWNELKNLRKENMKELLILREEIGIFKARGEAIARFGRTDSTSVIMGWAPVRNIDNLKRMVETETDSMAYLHISDPDDSDETPIFRKNPRWARPFEMLTEMFALPQYHEVDPTIILAPVFVLYFGLMLGDAIYGALVLVAGLLIYKGQGKVSKSMHDMGIILSSIGFSGVIFGIIQGTYLGPLNDDNPLTALLVPLGAERLIVLDSMNNPIPLLQLALIIGLVHLNLGLILAVWQNSRIRAYEDILLSQVSWFFLQFAGIVVFGEFFGWFSFPIFIKIPAYICGLAGLIMVFMQKGEATPEGKRKRKGPLAFFDITGFIGNWLSYARILALGLATAGIAMTINIVAILFKDLLSAMTAIVCTGVLLIGLVLLVVGYQKQKTPMKVFSILFILIGALGAIGAMAVAIALILFLILVIAHILNAVLQALGGFIHALRLHYVEFFGQFYSGGGSRFSPFTTEREYTVVEKTDKR